jgi:hypothetical protein
VREGSLVPASEVEAAWASLVLAARERLLSLPSQLVQRNYISPESEDEVIALCREALDELSGRTEKEPLDDDDD